MIETKSTTLTKLVPALIKAQKAMKAVVKEKENPYFKSKYADLSNIWEAVKDALHSNGLTVVQTTDYKGEHFGLITTLTHESGEFVSGFYLLNPAKVNDPQALGSAVTYSRRYALAAILGVVSEDDDGNLASGKVPEGGQVKAAVKPAAVKEPAPGPAAVPAPGRKISEQQGKRLYAIWKDAGKEDAAVRKWLLDNYGVSSTKDILVDDYKDICAWAEKKEVPAAEVEEVPY